MKRFFRRFLWLISRTFLVLLCIGMLGLVLRGLFRAGEITAASSVFYPGFCLGGWDYPQNASGLASLTSGAPSNDFSKKNSAYLPGDIASQIFCGYFPVGDHKRPPQRATVTFLWSMRGGEETAEVIEEEVINENIPLPEEEVHRSTDGVIAPSNGFDVEEEPPTVETSGENGPVETPAEEPLAPPEEPAEPPTVETSGENESVETPAEEPSVPPEENNSDAGAMRESDKTFSFRNFLFRSAYADEVAELISSGAFLEVSYSTDGIRWKPAGRVGMDNWQNYKIEIPIESWEDLTRLQIMISVLPSIDMRPEIYLESIALSVDYDMTVSEAALAGVAYVGGVADSLFGALEDGAVALVTPIVVPVEAPPAPPPAPVIRKEKKLTFEIGEDRVRTSTELPWQDDATKVDSEVKRVPRSLVDLWASENKKSLHIEGTCSLPYYVVLMWKNVEDYLENPGSFASNIAGPCENGSFSYDHNTIPLDTPEGDYYLLIAEENTTGPWVPVSDLIPIHIDSVIETIKE